MTHPLSMASESAPAVAVALPVSDPGADAWRTIARLLAWIGLIHGACTLAWFVLDSLGNAGIFHAFRRLPMNLRNQRLDQSLQAVQMIVALLLGVVLLIGSIGLLTRMRWGHVLLLAFAIGSFPGAALNVAWWVTIIYRERQPALSVVGFVVSAVHQLTFPAIVLAVMSRRAVRQEFAPLAPRSAFEPLPPPARPSPVDS